MTDSQARINMERVVAWDTYLARTKGLVGDTYGREEALAWLMVRRVEKQLQWRERNLAGPLAEIAA